MAGELRITATNGPAPTRFIEALAICANAADPRAGVAVKVRLANVACRAVHLVGVSLLVGGAVWDVEWARLQHALWLTIASGLGLLFLEVAADPAWLREGRGLAVVLKLAPLGLMPLAPDRRGTLLVAAVVIGAVGSHMPRWFRHAALAERVLHLTSRWPRLERRA